jgi:hypothetical protein
MNPDPIGEKAVESTRKTAPGIGTLNEKPLHAALKKWYARPDDRFEVPVEGFVVDIVRGDLLVEIQTRGFTSMKRKLSQLTTSHYVRLVYPIAREKWIVKVGSDGKGRQRRRKSPKRGAMHSIFGELVTFPELIQRPTFSLDVLLIQEEEIRHQDGRRRWRRRGWATLERRLLQVVEQFLIEEPSDLLQLIPSGLDEPFTTSDLAEAVGQPRRLAQQMAYCLRKLSLITPSGKSGNAIVYVRSSA